MFQGGVITEVSTGEKCAKGSKTPIWRQEPAGAEGLPAVFPHTTKGWVWQKCARNTGTKTNSSCQLYSFGKKDELCRAEWNRRSVPSFKWGHKCELHFVCRKLGQFTFTNKIPGNSLYFPNALGFVIKRSIGHSEGTSCVPATTWRCFQMLRVGAAASRSGDRPLPHTEELKYPGVLFRSGGKKEQEVDRWTWSPAVISQDWSQKCNSKFASAFMF